jgi:hypothetical protein
MPGWVDRIFAVSKRLTSVQGRLAKILGERERCDAPASAADHPYCQYLKISGLD